MSERARNIGMVSLIIVMAVTLVVLTSTRPAAVDRVEQLGTRIMCPVCQGESIANSPSEMAVDMMDLIAERVASGAADQQIIDELLSSYTGALLLDPPASGNTLALWLTPLIGLAAGIVVIGWWKRHPGGQRDTGTEPRERSMARVLVGALILVVAFAGIIVVASNSLQDRTASAAGVADVGEQDLSDVSNETMEAVIAANADNPNVNGMRLALAERYFENGDYRSAFPHYLGVAEDPDASSSQAITALVRLGWMAYDGNGEVDTANRLIDEALAIDPGSDAALYVKARLAWCGAGEPDSAVEIFETLLDDPELAAETRTQVENDLQLARSSASCP
jgi:cytochrome c-type biogenesis protein CcmH